MKTLFIEARHKGSIRLPQSARDLPKRIAVSASVQYVHHVAPVIKSLRKMGKTAFAQRASRAVYDGQILGCSVPDLKDADCVLFIGEGSFHPAMLGMSGLPAYVLSPQGSLRTYRLADKQLGHIKAGIARYHSSQRIGLLVSVKKGQNSMPQAQALFQKLRKLGRKPYIFLFDTLDFSQLENFSFVEVWVNTACPRIAIDDYGKFNVPVVNMSDIISLTMES